MKIFDELNIMKLQFLILITELIFHHGVTTYRGSRNWKSNSQTLIYE